MAGMVGRAGFGEGLSAVMLAQASSNDTLFVSIRFIEILL